jgi:hypothetical protein
LLLPDDRPDPQRCVKNETIIEFFSWNELNLWGVMGIYEDCVNIERFVSILTHAFSSGETRYFGKYQAFLRHRNDARLSIAVH